jgi:hypothetical protein
MNGSEFEILRLCHENPKLNPVHLTLWRHPHREIVRASSSGCHAVRKVAYFLDEVAVHVHCFKPQLASLSFNVLPEARNHLSDSYEAGVLLGVSQTGSFALRPERMSSTLVL